ncbi:MAG: phage morphogenesis protein [Sulfurospirillaceae bacterium]|nr:phage morphogenesis protein [Sulfurospirillaceae bacterium]
MPIEIQGLESIQKKLKTLDDALSPSKMRSTLLTVGNMVKNTISESFKNERSPFGEKWKPLKIISYQLGYSIGKGKNTHTKRGVQTKGFQRYTANKRILVESTHLWRKWVVSTDEDSVEVSNNTARTSKGYIYGLAQHYGTKNIQARPFLPIDEHENLEPRLLKTIDDYLGDKIGNLLK